MGSAERGPLPPPRTISKPATFEIQSEELTHWRVLWQFWSRGGSPRVSPHSFPPTLEFPEYVVAKGWMLSVDRPVGSIPLGFGAIRPAWVDFASGSSRRFDSTWGSPRFVPQGSISLVIRPVGFDFTGFWMRFVPHGSISLVSRPVGSISLGFGRGSSRRFDFAVESTRRVRSRCPQFANRPVGFDFARVRQAKLFKAFTTIIKPTFSGGVRGRVVRCPCLKACFVLVWHVCPPGVSSHPLQS